MTKKEITDTKKRFTKLFASYPATRIRRLETDPNLILHAEEEIQIATKRLNTAAERIRILSRIGGKTEEAIGGEFDRLMEMPQVKGIKFSADKRTLSVYVKVFSRKYEKKFCWGIDIPSDGDDMRSVCFTEFTGRYRHNEPLCLGNIGRAVRRYVKEYEFDAFVALLIEFLEDIIIDEGRADMKEKTNKAWESQIRKLGHVENQRAVYIEICRKRDYWHIPVQESIIASASARIQESTDLIRKAYDRSSELMALKRQRNLAQEFDKMAAMQGLERISVEKRAFVVTTEPIKLSNDGRSKCLGRFEISIGTDYSIGLVPIDAKDSKTVVHPSIRGDTILMKPDLRISIIKLLAEHRFSDVVGILLDFLKTYDPRLAFKPL